MRLLVTAQWRSVANSVEKGGTMEEKGCYNTVINSSREMLQKMQGINIRKARPFHKLAKLD